MSDFKIIQPGELQNNPFTMIGKEWMLVSAEKDGVTNTMTASWGGVGIMWHKEVAFVFIRPQRYTKEFVDTADTLSLSVLDNSYRKTLSYLGTVSGRDENKIEKSGLTVSHDGSTPYFDEANTVFICKKLFSQELTSESFIQKELIEQCYPNNDFHTMYVVEIEKILVK